MVQGPARAKVAGDWGPGMNEQTGASKVDLFLAGYAPWRSEFRDLRTIIREFDLEEDLKWNWPCYMIGGKNVVLIHGFKAYCALLFFKGVCIRDSAGLLDGESDDGQPKRQMRLTSQAEIDRHKPFIRDYIQQAIEIERTGARLPPRIRSELPLPEELISRLEEDEELRVAFDRLTPGRRRGYLLHFSEPKSSKSRCARIEKWAGQIRAGKGIFG